MYSTPHQNPCGVLAGFLCAYYTHPPACHDTNTYCVNMYICVDPISHFSYTIPISNLVHLRDLVGQLEDKAGQKNCAIV